MNYLKMKSSIVLFYLLSISFYSVAQHQKAQKPNILIILTDDLGSQDLSYYGKRDIRTPNIDLLARSGMRFDRFYANSPVCSPTRASLLSGRYPEMVGVPGLVRSKPEDNFGYLKPDAILLPKLLKQAQYNTAIIGKWNLGLEAPNTPNRKGFDFFNGFLDDMMDDYWTHLRNGKNFMRENEKEIYPQGHATDIFSDWAVEYIQKQKNSKNPFFLYLAYNAPHFPVQPPAEWLAKVKAREPGISDKRTKLVALIEHLDNGIGNVIRTLKETGVYDNTLIVFLSDNGGHLEEDGYNGTLRDGKQSVYEGGLRIPAFFVWANQIKANSVSKQIALTMDIYPTISEITGAKINHKIDGVSLLPVLRNPIEKLIERPVFFTRREGNPRYGGQTIQAVISDNWKLLQNSPFSPYELYNLSDDPLEKQNLISSHGDQVKRLQQLLIKQIQKGGSVPWQKPEND